MYAPARTVSRLTLLLALFAVLFFAGTTARAAVTSTTDFVPGEVLIKFAPQTDAAAQAAVLRDLGATELASFGSIHASRQRISRYDVAGAIARYRGDARLAYIEPNYLLHADRTPGDPLFSQLWGMQNTGQTGGTAGADIRATNAWDVTTGASPVLVSVIDTGMDYTHPDLAANVWTNPGEIPGNNIDDDGNGFIDDVHGWDFVNHDSNPMDDNGHGTHVSGTIGAVGDNGIGVTGVCWHAVQIMPLKFLDGSGSGSTGDAVLAIQYATMMHARILSNSWGGGSFSLTLQQAIQDASDAGILFVAAAGNDAVNNDFTPHFPANYDVPLVISVASTDANDSLSTFSCWGPTTVDLGAPGSGILSTLPGNSYGVYSGTSMATPHVSGALALMLSFHPAMTGPAAKVMLLSSVHPIPALIGRTVTGGRLDAFAMLAEPDSVRPAPVTDLQVATTNGDWVSLSWTATGDDSLTGQASNYDLRYSTSPITEGNFDVAVHATGVPFPLPPGSAESVRVNGLAFGTPYWFAVKVADEFGSPSAISNIATATTLAPPVVAVSPDSLVADLLTGAQETQNLHVANNGASDLAFHLSSVEGSLLAVMPDGRPLRAVGHRVPLDQVAAAGVQRVVDLGADRVLDRAAMPSARSRAQAASPVRVLGTEVFGSTQNAFYGGPRTRGNIFRCTTSTWLDEQRLYLEPTTPTQMWFLVYEGLAQSGSYRLIGASNISPAGPGAGWYSSGTMQVRLEPDRWYLIVGEWDQPVYYYNQSDVAPYPYPTSFGQLVAGAGWDWAPAASFPPDSIQDVPSSAFGSPVAYYQTLVTRPGPHWLTPSPIDGVIAAGANMDIAVAFDATSLNGGDYRSDLALSSNDPVNPLVHTAAHLHVTGAPDISLSRTSIDFGPRFTGTTTTDTLYVRNLGTDLLDVTNLSTSVGPFSVEPASFQLPPAGSQTVLVHYSPTATGPSSGTLSIDSNDPDEVSLSVGLAGSAADPPILVVTPDSLTADLITGEQANRTLHLENSGASDLAYHLTINASESVAAATRLTRHFRASTGSTATAAVPAGARRYEAGIAPSAGTRAIPAPTGALQPSALPGARILLVASGGDVSQIQASLAALPDVGAVDVFDSYLSVPTLLLLKSYDAAIVITSVSSQVSGPLGDVLADYADEGGGVVLTLASFVSGYQVGGRLFTGGYFPFQIGIGPVGSSSLGTYDPTHPIMRNVFALNADLLAQVNLANGAQLVASYTNGFPAVATQGHHVAAVNAFVGATGYWSGDLPRLLRNAVGWTGGATWITLAPEQGTLPPGTGVDLTATIDATGLFGGDYRAGVGIASNDPVHPLVTTPVHLHVTGAPDIQLSATALPFDTVFTGGTRADTLFVRNMGTDELVVSGVTAPSPFTVSASSFSLAPTARETLLVHFHPLSPGDYTGTLNVASNDADQPSLDVALDGHAIDPPIVGVSPDSITADLVTGETAERLVTVSNTGASDLHYRIAPQPASAAAIHSRLRIPPTLAAALLAGTATTDRTPSTLRARDTSVSQAKVLLIEDYLPWGLYVNEAILSANGVAFNVIGSAQLASTDLGPYRLVIVPSTQPTSFYEALALQSAKFDDFVSRGGVLEFHAAGQSGGSDSWLVTLPGGMHISQASYSPTNYSLLPQHPIMANVPLAFAGSSASHAYLTSIPASAKQIASDDSSRTNLVEYRFGNGTVLCGGQTFEFAVAAGWAQGPMLPNLIQYALSLGEVGWLSATPDNGTVPAGQNAEITARFDAAGLYGGDYHADLVISTNDPVTPDARMPAHLHVTGAPDITLSATTITFGTEYTGTTHTDSLLVRNDGTDVLNVSSVSAAAPYSADPASFTLAPLESRRVFVHFAPTSAGPAPGTLTITSDDPDEGSLTVRLFGTAILPPIIAVTPDSLGADLLTGQQATSTLHIANGGPSPLTFDIRASVGLTPHLALRPVARRIAPAAGSTGTSPSTQGRPDGPDAKRAPASKMASARVLIVEDYYPWGFASNETVLTGFGIPFDVINSTQFASVDLSPYTVLVVPSVQPTSFYATLALDSLKLANFVNQGGVFEFHAASQSFGSDAWLLPIPGGLHVIPRYASTNHVLLPGNPIVAGVPTDFSGSYASHSSLVSIPGSAAQITSDDQATTNCVVYHYGAGAVICSGQTLEFAWAYGWQGGPMLPNMLQYATTLAGTGWVRPDPQHASVPGGGNLDVTVTFDATGLYGGDYRTNLLVLSNDPVHPEVDVPAHLHVTGAPDIALSRTTIDFGSGFTGVARVDSFLISNVGTDILDLAPLSSDGPAFTVNPSTGFSVAPGAARRVYVTFLPPSAGGYSAILTVASNDPDHPTYLVGLSGSASDPPVIGLSPDSLTATLQPGQEEHQVLHVENTGGSPLQFNIDAVAHALAVPVYTMPPAAKGAADPGPSVRGHGGPDLFGYTWRDSDEPGGPAFGWIDISGIGTPLALFGDDATLVGVPIGFNFPFYGTNFPTVNVSTNGFLSFTSSSAQFGNVPLPNPFAPANLVAVLWDDLYVGGSSVFAYHDSSKCVISWVSVTELGSAYPMTFEVILWADGRIRYQYLTATSYWSQDATVGIQNGTGTDGLTVESDSFNYLHDGLAVELSRHPRFLTVSPPSGTLPAGGSIDLDATFSAVGAPIGDYRADVLVTSNDPVHPSRSVPAHLHVQGEPDIALSADHIAFGTVFSGTARTDSVIVTNAGTDILHVTGVSSDNTVFTAVPVSFPLTPGSSQAVRVTFSPPTNGPYSGTLTITSDDPDEGSVPVALTGNATDPPVAGVDTDSLVVTLLAGQQATRKIHLSNTGAGSLDFTTSARIHSANIESFAVPAGAKGEADPGLSILGHGGPDLYGYGWTDSDQPGGPAFDWVDILGTGTPLPVSGDDAIVTGVPIGFAFPFYGQNYTTLNVTTNGFLSFTSPSTAHFNTPLPDSSAPRNMLAVMWDDLFASPSTIYIRRDGTRTIVEWYYLQPLQGFAAHTFEVILYPDGRFKYQYLHSTGPWDGSTTVGIQNADASDGLTVQYNLGTFLHDQLAVAFDLNLRFLTVTPASGSLPPGNGVDLTAVLDAGPLTGGEYRGEIEIHSNDPIHPVLSVPAHLHVVGVPDIALAPSSIAFGDVFAGGTKAETLFVSNTGLEVLHVTDITSDAAAFSASPTAFTVSAGVTKPILARFTAPGLGPSSGTLSVHSDDPDEGVLTVPVSGNGTPPPILSSVPGSFSVSLVNGQKETRTLHLGNEGTVDLTYRLSVHGVNPPGALAAAARALAPATVPRRPGGFVAGVTPASRPFVAPAGGGVRASTSIGAKVLLVEDVLPYGLDSNEQLLTANGIAYDVINTSQLAATDLTHYEVMIIPSHQTNDAYNAIVARSAQIAAFVSAGGVLEFHGAAESGISNSDLVTLPGGVHPSATYQSLTNYVLVPGHELAAGLGDTYTAVCASYTHFSPLPLGVPKLIVDESNKATLVEYAYGSGHVIAAGQPLEFAWLYGWEEGVLLSNLIPYSLRRAEVGWLSISGVAGIVPPGEGADAELAFDPGDLGPGTYRALLTIGTNDPAHANVPIALQLDVSQVVGTNVSLASSKVDGGHVLIAWQGGAPGLAATVYRRGVADDWVALASLTADGGGGFAFEDAGVVAGQRYAYRLGIVEGGTERFTSEAWIDVPETARLALRGLASNPVVGDVVVTFSLPDARPATLELLDVLGRRVASQEVGVLGAGAHTTTLAGDVRPAPGLYLVRLRHPDGTLVLRAAVIR